MKSRDVIGKRIVAVHQTRFWDGTVDQMTVGTDAIELEDGTIIYLMAHETETEPYVKAWTNKDNKRKGKR